MAAVVAFRCDQCGDRSVSSNDVWLVRGMKDRAAVRCPGCGRLVVMPGGPFGCSLLMANDVLIIGDAELAVLAEIENPPTAC